MSTEQKYCLWFNEFTLSDLNRVGGKNASLGEMISQLASQGVDVPFGYACLMQSRY